MLKMTYISAGVVSAACLLGSAAGAETFTMAGTGRVTDQVMVPGGGAAPIGALVATSTTKVTMASGKALAGKGHCASWTTDPGSLFTVQGACAGTDDSGTYSVVYSCQTDAKANADDCWGRLTGVGGAYAGKTGTMSWRLMRNADGQTSAFTGAGVWN